MTTETQARAVLAVSVMGLALVAALAVLAGQDNTVPPRKNMLHIEIGLMIEDCELYGKQTHIDGLKCVVEKLTDRIEELEGK